MILKKEGPTTSQLRDVEGNSKGGEAERIEPDLDVYADALLLVDALERHHVDILEDMDTDALGNLSTHLSDVQRNPTEFPQDVADVLLHRLHHDRPVSGSFGSVQRTTRRNRSLKGDDEVLMLLEDAGIDRERLMGVARDMVGDTLDVTELSESDAYEIMEAEYVRTEVAEEREETRLQGLKDQLAAGDGDEAEERREESEELDWDHKCHDTTPFETAYNDAYEEYWNQPLGSARIGRLGMLQYRTIRDIQQAAEIECDRGDEAIIEGYDQWSTDHRGDVILFSNDRTFIERAHSHTILAQWIDLPSELPDQTTATWRELERLLYLLTITFGILELPTTTLHGVWRGKDGLDWQHERLKLACRSPTVVEKVEADLSIVETYRDLVE